MRDVSCKSQIGDSPEDEPVVQFLRIVYLVASRDTPRVEVSYERKVSANIVDDVSIGDLHMIDIKKNLDARRVDSRAHIQGPIQPVADLVLPAEVRVLVFAVHHFQAKRDALLLGSALHEIQKFHCVIGGLRIRHPIALSTDNENVRASLRRAFIDERLLRLHQLILQPLLDDAILDRYAASSGQRWNQSEFLERGPLFQRHAVEAHHSQARRLTAHSFERHPGSKISAEAGLLQAPLPRYTGSGLALCGNQGGGSQCWQEISAFHG